MGMHAWAQFALRLILIFYSREPILKLGFLCFRRFFLFLSHALHSIRSSSELSKKFMAKIAIIEGISSLFQKVHGAFFQLIYHWWSTLCQLKRCILSSTPLPLCVYIAHINKSCWTTVYSSLYLFSFFFHACHSGEPMRVYVQGRKVPWMC